MTQIEAINSHMITADNLGKKIAGDRRQRAKTALYVLFFLLIITACFSLSTGASDASLWNIIHGVWSGETISLRDKLIIIDIRLPRILMGILVGAALAVSGVVMQGLFRNPLADPGLVGVSSGAGLGAVSIIVLGGSLLAPLITILGIFTLPLSAFLGGLLTTGILYRVATRHGRTSVATMLLAGIALGALAGAITGILTFIADDKQLRDMTFWGLGSLAGATWLKIFSAAPFIILILSIVPFLAKGLNALALGEAAAGHLGVEVQSVKLIAITTVAGAVGASVAVSGGIGFVGIVVPHLLRLTIGPDHRYLLPASALLGAIMLLGADMISRLIVAPAELPIGIVTAAIGAPFFLWILLRNRSILDL